MYPSDSPRANPLNWLRKKTCSDNCRQIQSQRRLGKRGEKSGPWEPTEEELAEIERRKREVREKWGQGLVFAGVDD
jgi:transcription elongation GreA/GreB family factor